MQFMRCIVARVSFLLCFCLFVVGIDIFATGLCPAAEPVFYARVARIIDGDTIEIRRDDKILRVRIWGIDTPEWDQPYGKQSSQFTRRMLTGKEVQVIPKDTDRYGRLVAMITVDQKNVCQDLVASGMAWVHVSYCNEPICDTWKKLQERALSEHRGLWNDPHPIAPWVWKNEHRF